jgi:hypothetical protein
MIEEDIDNIYPDCMQVEETTSPPFKVAHYLDLNLEIVHGNIITSIYDKRRDFSFEIYNMPSFRSNIPKYIIDNVIKSQLNRYLQICSSSESFVFNSSLLHDKLRKNGYATWFLKKKFALFNKTHYLIMVEKFGETFTHHPFPFL